MEADLYFGVILEGNLRLSFLHACMEMLQNALRGKGRNLLLYPVTFKPPIREPTSQE